MTENVILFDLGVIAVTCAVTAILFDRLKLPVMAGYLLAGIFLGSGAIEHNLIRDPETVRSLSELGIIFLLFVLGMECDIRRFHRLMSTALLPVFLQSILMIYLGILVAPMLGFTKPIGLLLGSLMAVSSSIVTVKVLRDQKQLQHPHAQLALGIMMIEDILAILVLVIMSGIATSKSMPWDSVGWNIFFLAVFVVGIFYVGRIIMPPVLRIVHRIGSLELVTLFAVGVALGIGMLAGYLNLSLALGAFVAGTLFTHSNLTPKIEESIAPLKELFASVFFVSTGLMVGPGILLENIWVILLLSLLVVSGKFVSIGIGLFLAGQRSRNSFKAAAAKAHIGEFSFVIAILAYQLGWVDEKLLSVAVGVSVLTVLSSPTVSRQSNAFFHLFRKLTPKSIKQFAWVYHRVFCSYQSLIERSAFFLMIKRPFWQTVVAFFLINGTIIAANLSARYVAESAAPTKWCLPIVVAIWVATALLVTPFLLSIYRNLGAVGMLLVDLVFSGSPAMERFSSAFKNIISQVLSLILTFVIGGAFIVAISSFLPSGYPLFLLFLFIVLLALIFQRQMIRFSSELEHRFSSSFNMETRHLEAERRKAVLESFYREFDWKSMTAEKTVAKGSIASGKQIAEVNLRDLSGATIVAVSREDEIIYDPNPNSHLFSGDRLTLLGTEEQLNSAIAILDTAQAIDEDSSGAVLVTEAIYVDGGSFLEGNTLAGSELRRRHGITVVGVKKGDEPVRDPNPTEVLLPGDLLLVIGKQAQVDAFRNMLYSNADSDSD